MDEGRTGVKERGQRGKKLFVWEVSMPAGKHS